MSLALRVQGICSDKMTQESGSRHVASVSVFSAAAQSFANKPVVQSEGRETAPDWQLLFVFLGRPNQKTALLTSSVRFVGGLYVSEKILSNREM